MKEARIYILLGKKLSNEATDNELAELGQLLQDESVQPYLVELIQEVWQKKARVNEKELDEKWERTLRRFQTESENGEAVPLFQTKTKKMFFFRTMVAAGVVGLMLLSVWLLYVPGKQEISAGVVVKSMDSVTVALKGERKKIMLPDSTEVHLNSGSSLVYNKDFGKKNREVWLNGEAFFEVTKDASLPFLVNTRRMMVKVLGTVFNVKAYNTKENIETTVVEGKVEVSLKEDDEKKVILLPNEKISLKNNRILKDDVHVQAASTPLSYQVQTIKRDDKETGIPEEVEWVNEKVVFTAEPFEMVALKMERWYNVQIHFENTSMKDILINGDFDRINLEEALHILEIMIGDLNYRIVGKDIYIL